MDTVTPTPQRVETYSTWCMEGNALVLVWFLVMIYYQNPTRYSLVPSEVGMCGNTWDTAV